MLTFLSSIPPWVLILLALWTLPWKGVALWRAAQAKQKEWFVIFLLVNSLGILEILYLFVFSQKTWHRFARRGKKFE